MWDRVVEVSQIGLLNEAEQEIMSILRLLDDRQIPFFKIKKLGLLEVTARDITFA